MKRTACELECEDALAFINRVRKFNDDEPLSELPIRRNGLTPGVDILYRAIGRNVKASTLSVRWKGPYGWIETEIPSTVSRFLRQS